MPTHHPGTHVARNSIDLSNIPWALTTHLLSVNHDQLLRTTQHPFLAQAAKGTLPKSLISQWLANDRLYLEGLTQFMSTLLNNVRNGKASSQVSSVEPNIEARIVTWLESALQNAKREATFFQEVTDIYQFDTHTSPLHQNLKCEGLRRFETLFATVSAQQPSTFLPWLEGLVLVWATEKVYYEAWSWARRQDIQSSPRTFNKDADGGAMRREFIPNWSNRDFLMFVEELERILNEGVSEAVNRDEVKWMEVKARTDALWRAVLDAEESFWPQIPSAELTQRHDVTLSGAKTSLDGSTLNSGNEDILRREEEGRVNWNGHTPVRV